MAPHVPPAMPPSWERQPEPIATVRHSPLERFGVLDDDGAHVATIEATHEQAAALRDATGLSVVPLSSSDLRGDGERLEMWDAVTFETRCMFRATVAQANALGGLVWPAFVIVPDPAEPT